MKIILWPGDFAAGLAGLRENTDNRQILRRWVNTSGWGAVASIILVFAIS